MKKTTAAILIFSGIILLSIIVVAQTENNGGIIEMLRHIVEQLQGIKDALSNHECEPETVNINLPNPQSFDNAETSFQFPPQNIPFKNVEIAEYKARMRCVPTGAYNTSVCSYILNGQPCFSMPVNSDFETIIDLSPCIPYLNIGYNTQNTTSTAGVELLKDIFIRMKITSANC